MDAWISAGVLAALSVGSGPGGVPVAGEALPTIVVKEDNTRITGPCRVVIPGGTVIEDADGNGVLHIAFDGGVVEFAEGSELRGSRAGAMPDTFGGTGIRVEGRSGVTIRGARVSGFKVGIWATGADGLALDGCAFDDMWRQRLASTPRAEDPGDWLWPHENDGGEWRTNYGAAACVERSRGVTIRGCRVRRGQNGFVLDRVEGSRVYDNDASFLSGWGLAMWRSSRNVVSRNALDFCVRGYSHGVYNRGQDSAGILAFEQCSDNRFVENSVTHGGDGFFGFAGKEALGEKPAPTAGWDYVRRGCNDNVFVGNDFSFAAAHGLELTFSFGNILSGNRFVENAICGVWGGYSRQTRVDGANRFIRNGEAGYGAERGGVNIEHGSDNEIAGGFEGNACGVHLWWGEDAGIARTPWAMANGVASARNVIMGDFKGDAVGVHLRELPGVRLVGCTFADCGENIRHDQVSAPVVEAGPAPASTGTAQAVQDAMGAALGDGRPVGARAGLAGRRNIVMTEWGPWDHAAPLARRTASLDYADEYDLLALPDGELTITVERGAEAVEARASVPGEGDPASKTLGLTALSATPGVHRYAIRVAVGDFAQVLEGVLVNWRWDVVFFPSACDPREDVERWRAGAGGPGAARTAMNRLALPFRHAGPSQLRLDEQAAGVAEVKAADLPKDRFGTIAQTVVPLTPGTYRLRTLSDDGVRVRWRTGGLGQGDQAWRTVIERWTHHGPTRDVGEIVVGGAEGQAEGPPVPVEIEVEHFELDGYAVLEVELERVERP